MKKHKTGDRMDRRKFLKRGAAGIFTISTMDTISGCAVKPKPDLEQDLALWGGLQAGKSPYMKYLDAYNYDACIECGECLSGCPFKTLTKEEAIDYIIKLRKGEPDTCNEMIDQCCFCFKCNHRCPENARPAALMLQRLSERREEEKQIPPPLRYSLNGMEEKGFVPNVFRDIYTGHSEEERRIIKNWGKIRDCEGKDLLWCGCGVRIFPVDIENSRVFADLPKFGGENDCCGLFAARSGLGDIGRYVSNSLIEKLEKFNFKRLVVLCGSCLEMFKVSLPHYIGQDFPFEAISAYEYIYEKLENNTLSVKRHVPENEKDACISDSCHGYEFGDGYLNIIESLYTRIGYTCVPLEHHRENNACCGLAGFFRKGNIWGVLDASRVKRKDIVKSNKKNILTYCQGCYISSHLLMPGNAHYLLEKLLWALGDEIKFPQRHIVRKSVNLSTLMHMAAIGPSAIF